MIAVTDSAQVEPARERFRKVVVVDSAAFVLRDGVLFGEEGPLWFRGYVRSDGLEDGLGAMLESQGSLIHVVGHTPRSRRSRAVTGEGSSLWIWRKRLLRCFYSCGTGVPGVEVRARWEDRGSGGGGPSFLRA